MATTSKPLTTPNHLYRSSYPQSKAGERKVDRILYRGDLPDLFPTPSAEAVKSWKRDRHNTQTYPVPSYSDRRVVNQTVSLGLSIIPAPLVSPVQPQKLVSHRLASLSKQASQTAPISTPAGPVASMFNRVTSMLGLQPRSQVDGDQRSFLLSQAPLSLLERIPRIITKFMLENWYWIRIILYVSVALIFFTVMPIPFL